MQLALEQIALFRVLVELINFTPKHPLFYRLTIIDGSAGLLQWPKSKTCSGLSMVDVVQKDNTVGNSDMVIVTIAPEVDFDYLIAALELNPLELLIKELDVNAGRFTFQSAHPRGLKVSVLRSETDGDAMPNISSEPYKRLLQDRNPGTGFHIFLKNLTKDQLDSLKTYPLVMKLNQGNGFLMACPEPWEIKRTEHAKKLFVTDPLSVPEHVSTFLKLIDEPFVYEFSHIELRKKRLRLRIGFLEWYINRSLSYQLQEQLFVAINQLQDALLAAEQASLTLKAQPKTFNEFYLNEWASLLSQHLPSELVENLRESAMTYAAKHYGNLKTKSIPTLTHQILSASVEDIQCLVSSFKAHPGFNDYFDLMKSDVEHVGVHPCDLCGGKYSMRKNDATGLFQLNCKDCSNTLANSLCSRDPAISILAWNRRNKHQNPKHVLNSILDGKFKGWDNGQIVAYVTRIRQFEAICRPAFAEHNTVFKSDVTREMMKRANSVQHYIGWIAVLNDQARVNKAD